MSKVLSIVVPAYNSEAYLDRVLSSILEPTSLADVEVVIVNDGSADGTAAAAEKYCREYPQSVRLITQQNKGHGGALNTGIAAAVGKYIKVVDSDDWVETQNLPVFIEKLRSCESDVVLTHFNTLNICDNTVIRWKSYPEAFGRSYSLKEIMEQWGAFNQVIAFHGITYRRDFYLSTGVQLSEHVYYEDQEYTILPFAQAKTVTPLDLFIYDYRVGDAGQSVSQANQQKNISHFRRVIDRLMAEYPKLCLAEKSAGHQYYCMMLKSLLASFFMTLMLVDGSRKAGRKSAGETMKKVRNQIPEVYRRASFPYMVLRGASLLGIQKVTVDKILNSRCYNLLCHQHDLGITVDRNVER